MEACIRQLCSNQSEKLGSVRYAGQQLQYLGASVEDDSQTSPETRQTIDVGVQRLVTEQDERAQALLKEGRAALTALAQEVQARSLVLLRLVDGLRQVFLDTAD